MFSTLINFLKSRVNLIKLFWYKFTQMNLDRFTIVNKSCASVVKDLAYKEE